LLLYIVNLVFISFNSQIRFILQFKRKSKRATNASKTIINKKKAKDNAKKAKKTKTKTRKTKASAKASVEATTTIATITITTTNKKQLSKLCEQFACTHVNLVFEIVLILLSYLLLFNNLRKYTSNTLYS